MARVTGVGGSSSESAESKALAAWYAQRLGIVLDDYGGASLKWTDDVPKGTGMTVWSTFPQDTDYFGQGQQAVIARPTSTCTCHVLLFFCSGGMVCLLAGSQGRASAATPTRLSRHHAGRRIRRFQRTLRGCEPRHPGSRVLGPCPSQILRPAPGACFADRRRSPPTDWRTVLDRERDSWPSTG